MIIRVFHARARSGMGEAHERLMRELSMPLVEAQRGLIAFYAGRPVGGNTDEYTMVSLWEVIAALRERYDVSLEEVTTTTENMRFKLPSILTT